ncbi:MAG: hypothetical protein HOH33_15785 [Verrucomicrobia bacterium]|jgi:hypothetical protein|nr:hypothetical protein [Verrucomicrobiota bacterium]
MTGNPSATPNSGDQFDRLAGFASSFSMGAVAAFIASLKQINPTLEFKVGILTLISFIVCFGITWWVHRVIFDDKSASIDPNRRKKTLLFFGATSLLGVLSCMAFALKGISQNKLKDVSFGVVIAVLFISIAAFFFFKVVGFLQRDEQNNTLHRDS